MMPCAGCRRPFPPLEMREHAPRRAKVRKVRQALAGGGHA